MQTYNNILDTPISYLKGVGPKRAETLNKELQIFTFGDLLHHFPFRYIDKSRIARINELTPDTPPIQLRGRITHIETAGDTRTTRLTAILRDDSGGAISLVWFRGLVYFKNYLQVGKEYLVYGKPTLFKHQFSISHPDIEWVDPAQDLDLASRLEPVYHTTEKMKVSGLDSRAIYRLQQTLLEKTNPERNITEYLPETILAEYHLMARPLAFVNVHLPQNENATQQARRRLKFDEFFAIQMRLYQSKYMRETTVKGFTFPSVGEFFNTFYHEKIPFSLTDAQKRVLKEIRRDTMSGKQMNRLLQGDVGSGKTVVALMTMLIAADSGFQAAIMAPTEILAQQHYNSIAKLCEALSVNIALLTGSTKKKERKQIHEQLQNGTLHFLVGTHALLEDAVQFSHLGLVVIDEQHRFGVAQRSKMWAKNETPPHVLVMSATPIPRTLAMTIYGDLDVSVIDELPPGRKPIQTHHFFDSHRLRVFEFMRREIVKGRQIYVVFPLINESEKKAYKDLMDGYESIARAFPIPQYQVSVVHGQMTPADKEFAMAQFKRGETHIMVATTVIEVGVDVPNASVMVIESAESFGLAQLHQLRGRVGRGADQSYCLLMTGQKLSNDARIRMRTMTETTDGFKIAEVDLKLRGPGNLDGTQQSGILNLRIADIAKDQRILALARSAAGDIMSADPLLQLPEHQALKRFLQAAQHQDRSQWRQIS